MRWPPGVLLALDTGTVTGWAVGLANERPRTGSVNFGNDSDQHGRLFASYGSWLTKALEDWRPVGVAIEATLPLIAYRKLGTSEAAVLIAHGLRAITEASCYAAHLPCCALPVANIRKHFIGRVSAGGRDETKLAVVKRARALGYLGARSTDDDAGDAAACWDYAAQTLMRTPPKVLQMFGGG